MNHPLTLFTSTNLVVAFHEIPSAAWFGSALDALARFYRFVNLAEVEAYVSGGTRFNSCCHVTFDDGHVTFRDALPLLESRRIPATLFVSPRVIRSGSNYWFQDLARLYETVGEAEIRQAICEVYGCTPDQVAGFSVFSMLLCLRRSDIGRVIDTAKARHGLGDFDGCNITTNELRRAADSGLITVGAHTIDHPVLANESAERSRLEIHESVDELSEMLNRPVTAFAYPNGTEGLDFGPREEAFLADAGVRVAVTTDVGFFGGATRPLAISRGGCPSLAPESAWVTTARLALLPLWDRLSSRTSQAAERRTIAASGLLP